MKFNLFSKFNKNPEARNRLALKYGAYNAGLIAIVLCGILVLNILATALSRRFPLSVDLSTTKQNTVTSENVDFLKTVKKDVNIVLCATEEGYTGGYMDSYASQYYTAQDTTGGYYKQTLNLLKLYTKYNGKITLTFADPDATTFANVQKIVPDTTLSYGDILVYSTFKNSEGNEITNTRVLTYQDLYVLEDESGYAAYGYGSYTVGGSKVETAVSSAIYSVTSDETKTIAVLSGHGTAGAFDTLSANLELNNYNLVDVSDAIVTSLPEETDFVVIASPSTDLADSEIKLLENFLDNGGKKGKNLVVFCSPTSSSLPNLYAFLREWGVACEEGSVLYETDDNNFLTGDPLTMGLVNNETDYTASVNGSKNTIYIAGDNVPLTPAYTTFDNRETHVILSSQESTLSVAMSDYNADYTAPAGAKTQAYSGAILTADTVYDDDYNAVSSNVLVFSSADFISGNWTQYSAVGNNALALSLFNNLCGKDAESISFLSKTVSSFVFSSQPTATATKIMSIVFVRALPVLIIVLGVFVWIKRKNK